MSNCSQPSYPARSAMPENMSAGAPPWRSWPVFRSRVASNPIELTLLYLTWAAYRCFAGQWWNTSIRGGRGLWPSYQRRNKIPIRQSTLDSMKSSRTARSFMRRLRNLSDCRSYAEPRLEGFASIPARKAKTFRSASFFHRRRIPSSMLDGSNTPLSPV